MLPSPLIRSSPFASHLPYHTNDACMEGGLWTFSPTNLSCSIKDAQKVDSLASIIADDEPFEIVLKKIMAQVIFRAIGV